MLYQNSIFLNIPVSSLEASIKFYTAIGFVQNLVFSSAEGVMMSLPPAGATSSQAHEGAIKVMLLTNPFFKTFLPEGIEIADPSRTAQCLICLSRSSKESVDAMCEAGAANGGRMNIKEKNEAQKKMEPHGMYGNK